MAKNRIVKVGVDRNSLNRANKYLASTGYRICAYTGELLRLNSKNFHKMSADKYGFQPVSKFGKKLYNADLLEVKAEDCNYDRNMNKVSKLA